MTEQLKMLKFDLRDAWTTLKATLKQSRQYVDSVSITLPFGTVNLKPNQVESDTAKEIVIFLSDRRVLDSGECCDSCIEAALQSIHEIRTFLVQKQLVLKNHTGSVLYLLIEIMLTQIRQFQTYCQRFGNPSQTIGSEKSDDNYYVALNTLRAGLLAILSQIANIGRIRLGQKVLLGNFSNIEYTETAGYLVTWKPEHHLIESKDGETKEDHD